MAPSILAEATMRSAYEVGWAALEQAAQILTAEQDRQAILSPKTMDDVIALITTASDSQPGRAHRASQLEGSRTEGVVRRLRELEKVMDIWVQHYPECSCLIWTMLWALISQGSTFAAFMGSLYGDLTRISVFLSSLSFDPNFQTSINGQLWSDLYAAIIDFLAFTVEWMRRVKGRRFSAAFAPSSGNYSEGQRDNLTKIEEISSRIRAEQSRAVHSNTNQLRLFHKQSVINMRNPNQMRDLHSTPFAVMASMRAGRGANEVDHVDSKLVMKLGYIATVRGTEELEWINQTDEDRQNILHAASRHGYVKVVQWALQKGVDAKALDAEGRTPLFGAVEGCHDAVTRLLVTDGVARGMKINQVSKKGQSALDIAVATADAKGLEMVHLLLRHKASPTEGVDETTLDLLSSAAQGFLPPKATEHVSRLTAKDRFGYTALHEAVSFGRRDLVNSLIQCKVDINTRATVGGDSILHFLIERGCYYRKFYHSSSGRDFDNLPSFSSSHVQIARLLLESGVVATRTRWSDGLTPQRLIMKKLKEFGLGLGDGERSALEALKKILRLLRNPPPVRSQLRAPQEDISIPTTDFMKKAACNHFDISVVRNLVQQTFPVGDFIYGDLDEEDSKNKMPLHHARPDGDTNVEKMKGEKREERVWRWVHLPANNETWVKDLIRTFKAKENPFMELKWPDSLSWSSVNGFIETSFHEFRGLATHARFRRPMFTSLFSSTHPEILSLVIPYFDVEILESHCATEDFGDLPNHQDDKPDSLSRLKKWKGLRDAYGDLHTPCSLDQSYYLFLRDSTPRDKDQIVVKYAQRKNYQNSGAQSPKLLMVNQVWLWRIDPETLLTCFPNRRHENSKTELLNLILQRMLEDRPEAMDRMILQILIHAIGFVDEPGENAGLDENLFDVFEQSIAHEADAETNCYQELCNNCYQGLHDAQGDPKDIETAWAELDEKMCNIVEEVEHLRETKDILDELKMIQRVLTDQQTVVQQYEKGTEILRTEDRAILEDLKDSLKFRISKVERLAKDAKAVENSLNDLLDLKQKQANLIEARDTRRLANEADNRARAGEKQGKLIFLFTLVTVIFTPLSFASSLLAVPSQGFPQNSAGDGVGWTLWQVVTAIVVTEVIGVLIPMAFMWFWMLEGQSNEIKEPSQKAWNKLRNKHKMVEETKSELDLRRRLREAMIAGAFRHRDTIDPIEREDGAANC